MLRLFDGIVELSVADNWADAILEWRFVGIQYDKVGDFCICGHPIKEKCFVENVVNGNVVVVGNICINKFKGKELTDVFRALGDDRVNAALIGYAYEEGIINKVEFEYALDVWRKRKLSPKQRAWFNYIKKKIYRACVGDETMAAYERRRVRTDGETL